MLEAQYRRYLEGLDIASATRSARLSGVRTVERSEAVDLDEQFAADRLEALLTKLKYTSSDERAGKPNPSLVNIQPSSLYKSLAWYRSQIVAYREFLEARAAAEDAAEDPSTVTSDDIVEAPAFEGKSFALERDLQLALRANIGDLEQGLEVIDGGGEACVDAGRIDILARDAEGIFTIIELKAGTARPEAVAQVLAYMGCVADEQGADVRGILVAADFDKRVEFAARAVPNLQLRRYRYHFTFE